MNLSIITPVYNEGRNIFVCLEKLSREMAKVSYDFEILVVYDFDEDTSLPFVIKAQKEILNLKDKIKLVKNNVHPSGSGAIRSGIKVAKGEALLVTMSDGSDDVTQIAHMMELIKEGHHVVCPSRYCKGGHQPSLGIKSFIPRIVGMFLYHVMGLNIHDATNSYRLYSKKILTNLKLKSTHSFSVTLEITAKAFNSGYKITEIPTHWKDRTENQSHFPFWSSLLSYLPWFFLICKRRLFSFFSPSKNLAYEKGSK